MKRKESEISISVSSGNIFADLDLPNSEEYLVKAKLAYEISQLIKEKKLTQSKAAERLGIDQPKISALLKGRLSGFSIERLFRFFAMLNQDIEIVIKPHKDRSKKHPIPHIKVIYAAA